MNYETHLRMPTIGSSASHFIKLTASGGTDEQNERAITHINTMFEFLHRTSRLIDSILVTGYDEYAAQARQLRDEIAYRYGV